MVTQYSIKVLRCYISWGNFWGAIPFSWDAATVSGQYLKYTTSKWLRIKWWSFVTYAYFFLIYHIARVGYEAKYGNAVKVFKSCMYALGSSIPVSIINIFLFKSTQLEFVLNSFIHTTVLWRKKYFKKDQQQRQPLVELFLTLGFFVALTYPIPIGGGIFILPREQFFLTALIKPGCLSTFNVFPLAILHIRYMFCGFSIAMFLVAFSILVCPNAALFCEEISFSRGRYKSQDEMRNVDSMMIVYRSTQMFGREANKLISDTLLTLQFVLKRQIYIGNVAIVFMGDRMKLLVRLGIGIWTVLMTIVWGSVLITTSMPYDATRSCLATWKYSIPHHWSVRDKIQLKKFRKSCRPVRVCIGKFSFVQKNKLIKFLYSVSEGTMEALLTYEEAYNN